MTRRSLRLNIITASFAAAGLIYSWMPFSGSPILEVRAATCCTYGTDCPGEDDLCCSYISLGASPCSRFDQNYCRDCC